MVKKTDPYVFVITSLGRNDEREECGAELILNLNILKVPLWFFVNSYAKLLRSFKETCSEQKSQRARFLS